MRSAALGAWGVFAAMTAVYVHMAVRLPGGPDGMSDLHVYVGAVQRMLAGGGLYDFASFNGDRFTYPPSAGLAFAPLALVPEPVLRVLWTLLQCGAVAALAALVLDRSGHPAATRFPRSVALPGLGCLLLLSHPVFTGLFLGQVSLLVTLLVLLDALDVTPRWLRGVPTGLAAAVKLTPLAFVAYLWLTGRRRAALLAASTFVLATGAAALVLPGPSRSYWTSRVAAPPVDLAQADNQSLTGLLARLGWQGPWWDAVLVVASAAVAVLAYRRSRRLHQQGQVLAGAVVVGALVVVVSPISWNHHQTLLVVAAACLVAGRSAWVDRAWSLGVYLLMTLPLPFLVHLAWPPARPLTDNLVLLLAVLVACWVPFRPVATAALLAEVVPAPAASAGAAAVPS